MNIPLSPVLETALTNIAASNGLSPEEYVLELLERAVLTRPEGVPEAEWRQRLLIAKAAAAVADHTSPQEQRDSYETLVRSLDEDRPADRKLFQAERKGVTW